MSVQAAVVAYLKTVSGVTALVGSGSSARIRPFERFQGEALPAITYFLVDATVNAAWSGTYDRTRSRVQIDCWSDDQEEAITLLAAVRAATDGFTGTHASTVVWGCRIAGITEGMDRALAGSQSLEQRWYRQTIDWFVWHD